MHKQIHYTSLQYSPDLYFKGEKQSQAFAFILLKVRIYFVYCLIINPINQHFVGSGENYDPLIYNIYMCVYIYF